MKSANRSNLVRSLSLSVMTVSAFGAALFSPLGASVARADLGYNTEALSRIHPEDIEYLQRKNTDPSSFGAAQIGVTVISLGAAAASGRMALQQNTISVQRGRIHSVPVADGSLDQIRATPKQTLQTLILKDTVPGDVIRLEYVAGNEATLAAAVDELKHGKHEWEVRVAKLNAEKTAILDQIKEARGTHAGLPLNDQSRGVRSHYIELVSRLEKQLVDHKRVQADAEMRMHAASGQFHAAEMTLKSVRAAHHSMPAGYHVIRDILVDHKTATELDVFFMKNLGVSQLVPSKQNIPHIRIVRIQTPNTPLALKAARLAKAGSVGFILAGGIVVQELTVGAIGDGLTKSAQTQLSPEARTAPRN